MNLSAGNVTLLDVRRLQAFGQDSTFAWFFVAVLGISIRGTEHYIHQGARRCELHFGNSVENTIRFRLNNDDTVARALVTVG